MLERFFTSLSTKTGLPPGTIVHVGDTPKTKPRIRCVQYSETFLDENDDGVLETCPASDEIQPVTWLHIDGLHDTSLIAEFGTRYGFHPLILEDLVNTGHRPKIEELGDYIFIVITAFKYDDQTKEVVPNQVNILFNKDVVFSFQERDESLFSGVNIRTQSNRGRIRKKKADYLAYALLDTVVDNYFNVFDKIGERIEQLEEEVTKNAASSSMNMIHELKREVAVLKKSIWPLREVVSGLGKIDLPLIGENNEKYFRDLYDHVVQLIDAIEVFRDVLNGIRDLYLAMISNRMNEIMKVLTIIATIFIPLTFIAGIYGMNFKYMPELEWHWGYLGAIGLMLLCAGCMGLFFRMKKWL